MSNDPSTRWDDCPFCGNRVLPAIPEKERKAYCMACGAREEHIVAMNAMRATLVDIVGLLTPGVYTRDECIDKMHKIADLTMAALGTITDAESKAAVERLLGQKGGDHD